MRKKRYKLIICFSIVAIIVVFIACICEAKERNQTETNTNTETKYMAVYKAEYPAADQPV